MSQKNVIETFIRVRPSEQPYPLLQLDSQQQRVKFTVPRDKTGYVNNQKQNWNFKFNKCFDMKAGQQQVFDYVAKDVADSAIQGYNGTIFAYGQTGSGKTFTMTGGSQRYEDRGIIPRTISYLFDQKALKTDTRMQIAISYLQIYGNDGYDLLDADHSIKKIQDLPKVRQFEIQNQKIILKGLSIHNAVTQQDAINLLIIGDNNRVVAETSKNDASTRSHCIFIIKLVMTKHGQNKKTISTIHLVDLSGSERYNLLENQPENKKILKQAISINSALHFLQTVIVQLQKKMTTQPNIHVSYRNHLLTLVLRDSIGGNCKTKMIATISAQKQDVLQSITTCKFAMRVASIENRVQINQRVDPEVIIERLKRENIKLKAQIQLLKGENAKSNLYPEQKEQIHKKINTYINSLDQKDDLIFNDKLQIDECFYYFKTLLRNRNFKEQSKDKLNQATPETNDQIRRLKLLVQQRDNQIIVLLNLINKNKKEENLLLLNDSKPQKQLIDSVINQSKLEFKSYKENLQISQIRKQNQDNHSVTSFDLEEVQKMLQNPLNFTTDQLKDRTSCLEVFRKQYRKREANQQNVKLLKQKMQKGRRLGQKVNQSRNRIKQLKQQLQKMKKQAILEELQSNQQVSNPSKQAIYQQIDTMRKIESFNELKLLKNEINQIKNLIQRNNEKLQKDFEKYIKVILTQKSTILPSKINSSTSPNSSYIKNLQVHKHLDQFYKARDKLYQQ